MAAPLWAAGTALLNQALGPTGNFNLSLYSRNGAPAFHPATSMTTPSDFAHVGLGSFDLGQLAAALKIAPASFAWSTSSLSQARYFPAATTVGTKAIFAGGGLGSAVADIYDAQTGTWSTASLSQA